MRVCIAPGCGASWETDGHEGLDPYPLAMVACSMEHLALGARAWLGALARAEDVPDRKVRKAVIERSSREGEGPR